MNSSISSLISEALCLTEYRIQKIQLLGSRSLLLYVKLKTLKEAQNTWLARL